jgi:hypothetical protein
MDLRFRPAFAAKAALSQPAPEGRVMLKSSSFAPLFQLQLGAAVLLCCM